MKEVFKLGQEVWLSIHPTYTTTSECALEVTVYSIVREEDVEETFIKEYQVGFGTFDKPQYVKPDRLFITEREAIHAMKEELEEDIKNHQTKIDKYKGYLKEMAE